MRKATKPLVALSILAIALLPLFVPWSKIVLSVAIAKGLAVLGVLVLLRAGQVSFGQALYFGASAYVGAYLAKAMHGTDVFLLFAAGAVFSAALGFVIGLFVSRYRQVFFGMLNLAFSMVLYAVLEKFYHYTGGSDGLRLPRPTFLGYALDRDRFEILFFYLLIILALTVAWLIHRYLKTPLGQALGAVKTNETRLEYLGVSPRRMLLVGYVVAAVLSGLGGTAMAVIQGVVNPEFCYWVRSGELIFIAILGGTGNVGGAFVGALVYEAIRNYLAASMAGMWQLLLGAILLVIILAAPQGLIGIFAQFRQRRTDQCGEAEATERNLP